MAYSNTNANANANVNANVNVNSTARHHFLPSLFSPCPQIVISALQRSFPSPPAASPLSLSRGEFQIPHRADHALASPGVLVVGSPMEWK